MSTNCVHYDICAVAYGLTPSISQKSSTIHLNTNHRVLNNMETVYIISVDVHLYERELLRTQVHFQDKLDEIC